MRRRAFLAWLTTLAPPFLAACQTVPVTGRQQLMLVSEPEENQMGAQAYRQILSRSRLSRDPALNDEVSRVGSRIAAVTGRGRLGWEFAVIEDDRQVNAFALPGGKVAVYTGLFPVAQDEAGLATVVGHEIAHVVARHGAERASQQIAVQGGLALTMAALSRGDPRTVRTFGALLGAGAAVGLILPWSRQQESEADRLGLTYMARAGYDPRAALAFWDRVEQAAGGGQRIPEFLSTHPSYGTRRRQIERWIPELGSGLRCCVPRTT
jgi:predicted Zn-dependent protease